MAPDRSPDEIRRSATLRMVSPGQEVAVARHRVIRTRKESTWAGGAHKHIAALCLLTGGSVSKADAIARIRARLDTYYTEAAGLVAEVEVVDRCARCGSDYLRTNRDESPANNLLNLPDC